MTDDIEAAHPSHDPGRSDEPERLVARPEDADDWRSEFRSYLDDPE
jgi:hypothetical protein